MDLVAPTDKSAEERRANLDEACLQLARLQIEEGEALHSVLRHASEIVAEALGVARVGVWLLTEDRQAIRCFHLYQPASKESFEGAILHAQDFPEYFASLELSRVIPVVLDDADASAQFDMRQAYMKPLGISALLDAPIYRGGKVVGAACHEHIGPKRAWAVAECEFAASVADALGRLLEEMDRRQAESTLGGYRAHILELGRLEALGRMAAGIAHDFRNILLVVHGNAELILLKANVPLPALDCTRQILEASERAHKLIKQLLAYGRATPDTPTVLDLRPVLLDMEKMLASALGAGITLRILIPPTLGRVFMDQSQVERVLLNLALNARDAMPLGGLLTLEVSEGKAEANGGSPATYVILAIRDTGSGMDDLTKKKLFEPFFTTKGDQGAGLGMATVQQIVSRAGGYIQVESAPGQGTTIRCYLPRIAGSG